MKKDLTKAGICLFAFFYLSVFVLLFLTIGFNVKFTSSDYKSLVILDFVTSAILTVITLIVNKDILKIDYRKIKKEKVKKFLTTVFVAFALFSGCKLFGAYLSAFIGALLDLEPVISDNQNIIEMLTGSAPVMMIISATVFASINEELIFRGCVHRIIKNKKVFVTVSGLIFGLMHVTNSVAFIIEILVLGVILSFLIENTTLSKNDKIKLFVLAMVIVLIAFGFIYYFRYGNLITKIISLDIHEIVNSVSYITLGLYLAVLYVKCENIYVNIAVHAINNFISMIAILFLV